jgi:phage shock protein C
MEKRLYKSRRDKMLAGVCGGLANYLGIDPTIVRLIWALTILFAGTGLLAYIICAIVIPEEPYTNE